MKGNIIYDYSALRGRIKERVGTEKEYADRIGRSVGYVSNVFHGNAYFQTKDITKGSEVLDIKDEDIGRYFFTQKVCN